MPRLDLSTSFQSVVGFGVKRAINLVGSSDCAIQLEAGASAVATTGAVIVDARGNTVVLRGPQSRIVVDDPSAFVRYTVIRGTVTACYLDAEADPAVGPAGAGMAHASYDKSAADGAASTATSAHTFYRAPAAQAVSAVRYLPDAALVANDTNYATITVAVRNADGTLAGTAASITTKITGGSGDWTANVPVSLTLGATVNLTAGQTLTAAIAKAGAGVAVPAGDLQVDF